MPNTVQVKRSAVSGKVPLTTDLQLGELAVNTFDGKLFLKRNNGTESVVEIGASGGGGGSFLPIAGGALTGSLREARVAMGAGNSVDIVLGNYFTKTITASSTFTVANVPADGTAASFILDLTNGGAFAVVWWSGLRWANGTSPSLTISGRDVLGFFTHDGGVTWTGLVMGRDVR